MLSKGGSSLAAPEDNDSREVRGACLHQTVPGQQMRTQNNSLTVWVKWDGDTLRPLWDGVVGVELYDHINNTGIAPMAFDDFENVNLAGKPE